MYVLLENSISFETKLNENDIDYFVDYEEHTRLHQEGERFFILEKDRAIVDQIIISSDLSAGTETINSFISRNAKGQFLYLKFALAITLLTILLILLIR